MLRFVSFTNSDCKDLVNHRKGETKLGEHVQIINNLTNIYDDLNHLDVDYVIFGIKEDIGVIANHGNSGTHKAWNAALKVLLNIQSNAFTKANRTLILGHLDYSAEQKLLQDGNLSEKKRIVLARKLVEQIDADVSHVVFSIVKAGKTPIIIGGGHNNAYANIKGTSLALKRPINAVNFDAHHDFRIEEGRHSGNGFSYAHHEGFLKNYFVFGLHENYVSEHDLNTLNTTKTIQYSTFEDIVIIKKTSFTAEIQKAKHHVASTNFGLEIDCDAIENIASSAMTPSGFSVNKARQFVSLFAKENNVSYLHICEGAPTKKNKASVGKLITYLITDFFKAHASRNY